MRYGGAVRRGLAVLLVFALAFSLSGCLGKRAFTPGSVRVESYLSSVIALPTADADTVKQLYGLYTGLKLGESVASPDRVWEMNVVFTDASSGTEVRWDVCRDGSCRVDGGDGYYQMQDGDRIYAAVKSAFAGLCDVQVFADKLYALKAPYIGSASADAAILDELHIDYTVGSFTISLQTASEPYGITLHLTLSDPSVPNTDIDTVMGRYGYLFLALVDNAGTFSWDYETSAGVHSSRVTSDEENVKKYGESLESFTELCGLVDSLSATNEYPADVSISTSGSDYVMYGAPASEVDKLWGMAESLKTEPCQTQPDQSDSVNLIFYDSAGKVLAAWSFFGSYCRKDGGSDYCEITGGELDLGTIRSCYTASRTSADYTDGVYAKSALFADKTGTG